MRCIATFFSHFGAIRFKRRCDALRIPAQLSPVPRALSSSCGTCVRFEGPFPEAPSEEIEQIVEELEDGCRTLYLAQNA